MDGLSVAGSVVGCISLAIQVTESLVKYYSAYKDREPNIAHTTRKLEGLLIILQALNEQLTTRKFCADEQQLVDRIERSVEECEDTIQELQAQVDKFTTKPSDGVLAATRNAAHRVAYPLRQSTLQKLAIDIEEIVAHMSLALQILEQKDLRKVQDDIADTKALLDLVRASQIKSEICAWLEAPDSTINYNQACSKRHPGTGLWFVNGANFTSWLSSPGSFLWLNGFAGCGKSVLCSTAIRYAFRHRRSNPRVGIAFFFFTFSDISKQNSSAMLRTLIQQLSSQRDDKASALSRLHDSYRHASPPDQALMDCLRQLVQEFDDVYLFLDALDESPRDTSRGDVLQTLIDIKAWAAPQLHLLVTSRDEVDIGEVIRDELGVPPEAIIPMDNDAVGSDIAAFVSGHLKTSRGLRRWAKHHQDIENALIKRANGV